MENVKVVRRYFPLQKHWQRLCQRILADADLDGDFPVSGRADFNFVVWIGQKISGGLTQQRIIEDKSEKGVRIQEQPHGRYSLKSLKCSSSSA